MTECQNQEIHKNNRAFSESHKIDIYTHFLCFIDRAS